MIGRPTTPVPACTSKTSWAPIDDLRCITGSMDLFGRDHPAVGHDSLDTGRFYLAARQMPPEELLAPFGVLARGIAVEPYATTARHDLGCVKVIALVKRLRTLASATMPDAPTGIVISTGPTPLVLTVAMRPPSAVGADPYDNLCGAVATAQNPHAVLVITMHSDGVLLNPADFIKAHASRVDAYRRPAPAIRALTATGMNAGATRIHAAPTAGGDLSTDLRRVEIIYSSLGADGEAIHSTVESATAGLVSADMGSGFTISSGQTAFTTAMSAGVVARRSRRTPRCPVTGSTSLRTRWRFPDTSESMHRIDRRDHPEPRPQIPAAGA